MNRSASARLTKPPTSPAVIEVTLHNGLRWQVGEGHGDLIQPSGVDWFNLESCPNAERVKHNAQRDVWRVRIGEREYFAKLYHPAGPFAVAKVLMRGPTALREWAVGAYALSHGISAVVPVAAAWSQERMTAKPSLLVTEAVGSALPLSDHWASIRHDRLLAERLIEDLARLIARAHQCGFQHGDMHPGNILVRSSGRRGEALFVDLHNVCIGRSVGMRQIVANLAQLNQWFRRNASRTQRRRFLHQYIAYRDQFGQASPLARNWRIEPKKLVVDLNIQAERHANKLWAKRDRRTRRNGKYFARLRPATGWRGYGVLQSKHPAPVDASAAHVLTRREWNDWLRDPLSWVDATKNQLVKDSHTATICRASLPARPHSIDVIVKRPLARNFWKKLAATLGPSRNWRAWRMAHMLRNRDLPAAQPLAIVERYFGLTRTDSILFVEYVTDSVDLETFMTRNVGALDPRRQRAVKATLIESVVRLLKTFHERGFVHRDLKAPNLLVNWTAPYDGRPNLTLIDMDGIRHVWRPTEGQQMRALVRLCSSLLSSPGCTCTDRLRFLKGYLTGPGQTAAKWKDIWRQIHVQVCEKLYAKEDRRKWKLAHYGRA
jgi:tRNA A-37 threonylcarbamoyl transferase component Bud32